MLRFGSCIGSIELLHRHVLICRQPIFSRPLSLRQTSKACATAPDVFDLWLADNPPPAQLRDSSLPLASPSPTGPTSGLGGAGRYFHWSHARAEAAQLARSHAVHWSTDLDGYLCTPKNCTSADAAAALGSQQPDSLPHEAHQHLAQGSDHKSRAALLLRLPSILWSAQAAQLPVVHFYDLAAKGACPGSQMIVLLSADSAALALCRGGKLVRHKTLTGYTVRKNRNGKAQLTYKRSNTGRNSIGGGIRMQETRRLFDTVAARLVEWRSDIEACDLFVFSGSVRVWNEVFDALGKDAFLQRRDPRWYRLPRSVPRPRFKDVRIAVGAISYGTVTTLQGEA